MHKYGRESCCSEWVDMLVGGSIGHNVCSWCFNVHFYAHLAHIPPPVGLTGSSIATLSMQTLILALYSSKNSTMYT